MINENKSIHRHSKSSNKLLPTIIRLFAIGVVGGNVFFLLYYLFDLPPIIGFSSADLPNIHPDALYIIRDPINDVPEYNLQANHNINTSIITIENRFIRRPPRKNCSLPPG
eukprot:751302_1